MESPSSKMGCCTKALLIETVFGWMLLRSSDCWIRSHARIPNRVFARLATILGMRLCSLTNVVNQWRTLRSVSVALDSTHHQRSPTLSGTLNSDNSAKTYRFLCLVGEMSDSNTSITRIATRRKGRHSEVLIDRPLGTLSQRQATKAKSAVNDVNKSVNR